MEQEKSVVIRDGCSIVMSATFTGQLIHRAKPLLTNEAFRYGIHKCVLKGGVKNPTTNALLCNRKRDFYCSLAQQISSHLMFEL